MNPRFRRLALSVAYHVNKIDPWVHLLGVVLAVFIALSKIVSVSWSEFELSSETFFGIGIIALILLSKYGSQAYLARSGARLVGVLKEASEAIDGFPITAVASDDDVSDLAEYLDQQFPAGHVSALDLDKRKSLYHLWKSLAPGFGSLVREENHENRVVGCSIFLPIKMDTFIKYRNGIGAPGKWGQDEVDSESNVLFMPALHISHSVPEKEAARLASELFASGAANGTMGPDWLVLAPIKTPAGRRNVQKLGFEGYRSSNAGFEIWELDARRSGELSNEARRAIEVVNIRRAQAKKVSPRAAAH